MYVVVLLLFIPVLLLFNNGNNTTTLFRCMWQYYSCSFLFFLTPICYAITANRQHFVTATKPGIRMGSVAIVNFVWASFGNFCYTYFFTKISLSIFYFLFGCMEWELRSFTFNLFKFTFDLFFHTRHFVFTFHQNVLARE